MELCLDIKQAPIKARISMAYAILILQLLHYPLPLDEPIHIAFEAGNIPQHTHIYKLDGAGSNSCQATLDD